jgi:hypothetical protein
MVVIHLILMIISLFKNIKMTIKKESLNPETKEK